MVYSSTLFIECIVIGRWKNVKRMHEVNGNCRGWSCVERSKAVQKENASMMMLVSWYLVD